MKRRRKKQRNVTWVTQEEIYRAMEEEQEEVKFEWEWKEYSRTIDLDDLYDTVIDLDRRMCWVYDIVTLVLGYEGKFGELGEFRLEGNMLHMSYKATTQMNLKICDVLVYNGIHTIWREPEYSYYRY